MANAIQMEKQEAKSSYLDFVEEASAQMKAGSKVKQDTPMAVAEIVAIAKNMFSQATITDTDLEGNSYTLKNKYRAIVWENFTPFQAGEEYEDAEGNTKVAQRNGFRYLSKQKDADGNRKIKSFCIDARMIRLYGEQ